MPDAPRNAPQSRPVDASLGRTSLADAKEADREKQLTPEQLEAAKEKPTKVTLATGTRVTVPASQADALKSLT